MWITPRHVTAAIDGLPVLFNGVTGEVPGWQWDIRTCWVHICQHSRRTADQQQWCSSELNPCRSCIPQPCRHCHAKPMELIATWWACKTTHSLMGVWQLTAAANVSCNSHQCLLLHTQTRFTLGPITILPIAIAAALMPYNHHFFW